MPLFSVLSIENFASCRPDNLSHAASFAVIAYASSWLKCWHSDVFYAALLNAKPMGFYAPAQIVRDAQEHGVEVRPVCVNRSRWDCTLEPSGAEKFSDADDGRFAVRLGLRMVRGLGNADAARLVAAREDKPFASVDDLWRRARLPHATLAELAEADSFRPSIGLSRRDALWAIKALRDEPLPLFAAAAEREVASVSEQVEPVVRLRAMPEGGEVVEDYGRRADAPPASGVVPPGRAEPAASHHLRRGHGLT